jgi:hypothetical protein
VAAGCCAAEGRRVDEWRPAGTRPYAAFRPADVFRWSHSSAAAFHAAISRPPCGIRGNPRDPRHKRIWPLELVDLVVDLSSLSCKSKNGRGAHRLPRDTLTLMFRAVTVVSLVLMLCGCGRGSAVRPVIEFTRVPDASEGGPEALATIAGRVTGARSDHRIVLFAKSGVWWVQPLAANPFTTIRADTTWTSDTHLGFEYAALLVDRAYTPPVTLDATPQPGGSIAAVAIVKGVGRAEPAAKRLSFSGYEWEVRQVASERGGTFNVYDPGNAWTDDDGFMHLRIAPREPVAASEPRWSSAEVMLARSLGYGTYMFVVRETAHLEPAAVFSVFTWDSAGNDPSHREMDIELTQWGDPASKNAQYVVQPYYVPANVARFDAAAGVLTHVLTWEPGRASFRTFRGGLPAADARPIVEHEFTSGVPVPGGEAIHMSLYVFRHTAYPVRRAAEVVVEKFLYLP